MDFQGIKNLPNEPWCASWVLDEWKALVQNLVDDLNQTLPEQTWKVAQIKEKFWGLRFYVDYDYDKTTSEQRDAADILIDQAESESYDLLEGTNG